MGEYFSIIKDRLLVNELRRIDQMSITCVNFEGEVCFKYEGSVQAYIEAMNRVFPECNDTVAYQSDGIYLDLATQTLRVDEAPVHVTPELFSILKCLMKNYQTIVSMDRLSEVIVHDNQSYNTNRVISDNTMRTLVSKLRCILRRSQGYNNQIKTSSKKGYYWNADVQILKRDRKRQIANM